MPELATDALRALALSARNGFRFDNLAHARQHAVLSATGQNLELDRVEKLSVGGSANLGIARLWFGQTRLIEKTIVNPREFRVTSALVDAPGHAPIVRVFHTSMRGPLLRIYFEELDMQKAPPDPEVLARLCAEFSDVLTPILKPIAPSVRKDLDRLNTPSMVKQVSELANLTPRDTGFGLTLILGQPWSIQHCDLHGRNIGTRADGTHVAFDLGETAWNLQGADFYKQLPKWTNETGPFDRFDAATDIGAKLWGLEAVQVKRAALLYMAARHYRFARRHRDKKRAHQAAHFAALALSLVP